MTAPPPLAGTRVLDFADEGGAICGKILADLGADVVKVEPIGGCPTRRIPPFLGGEPGPDRSAYAIAYHAGKRSVTLDPQAPGGREVLGRLANCADFLVESTPAALRRAGIDLAALRESNSRLITVSITPYGDRGPSADAPATDITMWASSGMMHLTGSPGRAPLRMSVPQAGHHAGAEAAVACLLAHLARERTGAGQHVVVNTQAAVLVTMLNAQAFPILHGDQLQRNGIFVGGGDIAKQSVFPCKDGFVATVLTGGTPTHAASTKRLVEWMDEEGYALAWMNDVDWSTWSPSSLMADSSASFLEKVHEAEAQLETFFRRFTRQEIYAEALKRKLLVAPVATVEDIAHDRQLEAREYFHDVDRPHVTSAPVSMPGAFAKLGASPLVPPRPAPRVGEHNDAVYGGVLGLTAHDLADLRASRTI